MQHCVCLGFVLLLSLEEIEKKSSQPPPNSLLHYVLKFIHFQNARKISNDNKYSSFRKCSFVSFSRVNTDDAAATATANAYFSVSLEFRSLTAFHSFIH